jgi:ribose transport system substrate-binding protein
MKYPSLTCALIAFAGVFACGAEAFAGPRIGVLTKSKAPFWAVAEQGAQKAGAEFGADVVVKSPMNEGDVAIQIQQLNTLVAQGVDAIVIAPSSKDTLIAPLAAAAGKGIKIVLFDTKLDGDQPYVFVGTDQRRSGQVAGELLASLVAPGDPIGFLKNNQTSGATLQRELGAFEKLRELREGFALCGSIFVGVEKGAERERIDAFFDQHPEAKGVLASSTTATLDAIDVLKERKLAGTVKCVGFGFNLTPDVAQAIEQDVLQGWVAQLPGRMGYDAVKASVALCKGETVPLTVTTDFIVVTKQNLKEPQVQALLEQ